MSRGNRIGLGLMLTVVIFLLMLRPPRDVPGALAICICIAGVAGFILLTGRTDAN